jgi:hypothetical protein
MGVDVYELLEILAGDVCGRGVRVVGYRKTAESVVAGAKPMNNAGNVVGAPQ